MKANSLESFGFINRVERGGLAKASLVVCVATDHLCGCVI